MNQHLTSPRPQLGKLRQLRNRPGNAGFDSDGDPQGLGKSGVKPGCDSDTSLADYIADNYGRCRAEPCRCRRQGWIGRKCLHWVPVQAHTWDLLQATLAAIGGVRR